MAVVFISPKQRQGMFFLVITAVFVLFLAAVFFGVFLSKPKITIQTLTFNKPKVTIDMSVFDTIQFKNLQPFPDIQTQYSYTASSKDGKVVTGFITASSINAAEAILAGAGLSVSVIQEAQIGRDNPFSVYYQVAAVPSASPPKK